MRGSVGTTCTTCGGSKHVLLPSGTVARCSCVRASQLAAQCLAAGVPPVCVDTPLATVAKLSTLPGRLVLPMPDGTPQTCWVCMDRTSPARPWAVALAPMLYLHHGLGTVGVVTTPGLIDGYFNNNREAQKATIARTKCLVVEIIAQNHRMLADTLMDVLVTRSRVPGLTVYVSDEFIPTCPGRYGPSVCRYFERAASNGWRVLIEKGML